jgi:hypothetical protein
MLRISINKVVGNSGALGVAVGCVVECEAEEELDAEDEELCEEEVVGAGVGVESTAKVAIIVVAPLIS